MTGLSTNVTEGRMELSAHAAERGVLERAGEYVVDKDLCASYSTQMHDFAITRTLPLFAEIGTSEQFLSELGTSPSHFNSHQHQLSEQKRNARTSS